MYDNHRKLWQRQLSICTGLFATVLLAAASISARAQELQSTSVIRKISGLNEKLELTTNTSRILTLDKNIPRVQVNNPELLAVTPLSATQVQISAKKAGVTQINLWDDEGKVHAVDVLIYGDARELEVALQTQFPHASIKVFRYSESLVLTGYVDRPDHVSPIMQLAADYSPKVINNISVGGVQQILLKVKVMEVSRSKLRQLDTDFAVFGGNGGFFASAPTGLIQKFDSTASSITGQSPRGGPAAASFGIVHNNTAFFGFLDWLQKNQVAKILAEPNIVAVSGRPAQFQDGGETPIPVPQSLGTTTIEFKPFGTIVDFLPIVLGNGNIRLEVRPQIIETDFSHAITVNGTTIPAFNTRKVDTAVEMKAGQTFALAGLVQEITTTTKTGLPYVSDLPIIGVPFRGTNDVTEETELLIVVTPELVDPLDACEVPCGGPGTYTTSPTNRGLYCAGHVEVPTACNPTSGLSACGQDQCGRCNNGGCLCNGAPVMNGGMPVQGIPGQPMMPNVQMSGGAGYDESANATTTVLPTPESDAGANALPPAEAAAPTPSPQDLKLPDTSAAAKSPKPAEQAKPDVFKPTTAQPPLPPQPSAPATPNAPAPTAPQSAPVTPVPSPNSGSYNPATHPSEAYMPASSPVQTPAYSAARSYTPQRQPVFVRNPSRPNNPQVQQPQQPAPARENSLIGPVGYEQ
jgi:pilus assembly protein CpaC